VAAGEVGEIVVSGDHVLTAYLGDPEANRSHKIRDGSVTWHRTGDAGRLDPEGRLWLMGRVKRRVLRRGQTWWGLPAELRALRVEGVRHAAYLGRPDPELGQAAVLCVEIEKGRLGEGARERLLAAVAPHPVDELHALQQIPRDPRHRSKTDTDALLRVLEQRPV
jgi:acyl-CoA synthetase (AMP-forming)/AMP-acid ligase II